MNIAYFALTEEGRATAERICIKLGGIIEPKEKFAETVADDFKKYDALVFVMAAGIVVRTIAPLIQNKLYDPAVVVLDQRGKFAVSLLSGHIGGANRLTEQIAEAINAVPVITTATDIQNVTAFDIFAKRNNLIIENISELKYISSALLCGKSVGVVTDFPIEADNIPPNIIISDKSSEKNCVVISDRSFNSGTENAEHILYLRPKSLVVGIGCKRMISLAHLEKCLIYLLEKYNLNLHSVGTVATVSLKEKEPAILELCKKYGFSLEIIPDEKILECSHNFEESAFVKQITGLPSVAEASSYIASGGGTELTGKVKFQGVTMSVCRKKIKALNI